MGISHEALGARMADSGGRRLPRHYGRPAAEYAAARENMVVVDRPDRAVLRVEGRDPVRMLQGLITNDLAAAREGAAVYAAFLTPRGRMLADARLVRYAGEVLVDTAVGAEGGLREHLRRYLPPRFARVAQDSGLGILGVYGPRAGDGAAAVAAAWPDAIELPPLEVPEGAGIDLLVPQNALGAAWGRLVDAGARPAGHDTLEVLRIEAGRPRWGAELDESIIPLEAGLKERAISTSKGCYTGQEVIVRILHRGHVNRQLRGVLLGDAPPPAHGDAVLVREAGRALGAVTSACVSPALGQTIALAYVRREVEPGAIVEVNGREGRLAELPFVPRPGV